MNKNQSISSSSEIQVASVRVTTFYKFKPFIKEDLPALREKLESHGQALNLRGLFLIGTEGFNATICGEPENIEKYKVFLLDLLNEPELFFKDSDANHLVFHLFKVKIRQEIVTLDRPDMVPISEEDHHVSPEEWDRLMAEEEVMVIDTRNSYETEIGKFKGALDLQIDHFHDFPERIRESQLPQDGKYLIYCTGGIRCEKAILALREQGYQNVYQLNGGILNYFKERGSSQFEGECFVFDHRVAVDSELKPSQKYRLCPHCGQTAAMKIDCRQCGEKTCVCEKCIDDVNHPEHMTCSKNCAHHFRLGHKTERVHRESFKKRLAPLF